MWVNELSHLLDYIHDNNNWGVNMYEIIHERNRPAIKYVDPHFDTRDGRVYAITLKQVISLNYSGQDFTFRVDDEKGKSELYKFLNGRK